MKNKLKMKQLTIEECRPYLLDTLKHIDLFCRKNDIQYSLGYGTLIGAIRHKGFIPWDDDIDIIMTRKNYDKFINLYQNTPCYVLFKDDAIANHLHAVISNEKTYVTFPKGTTDDYFYKGGLWVDLFPLDGVDDEEDYLNRRSRILFFRQIRKISELGGFGNRNHIRRLMMNSIKPFLSPFSKLIGRHIEKIMKKKSFQGTKYVSSFSVWYWKQKTIPNFFFDNYIETEFEGHHYQAIKEYDHYLRDLYGDYMQFPPEDERTPKHNYKAFLKMEQPNNDLINKAK